MTLRRDLKHDFLPFHMGAKQQVVPTRVGKPAPGPLELDNKEMSLVDNIIQLMAAARFHLVTEEVRARTGPRKAARRGAGSGELQAVCAATPAHPTLPVPTVHARRSGR